MSAWRRFALEKLPEHKGLIEEASNPMALWIDLQFKFEDIYIAAKRGEPLNDDLIGRFYAYAHYCLHTADTQGEATDLSGAVCCAFYEHIILKKSIRDDLHRWMSPTDFKILGGVFTYHYPEYEFKAFAEEFLQKSKEYHIKW